MLDEPVIIEAEAQPAAVIRLTIPRDEIRNAMGPARGELIAALESQGVAPAGPWFSHHFRMDPATFDFELGVPVARAIQPTGRVRMGELPAGRVIRATYHGPYEKLGEAWGEFSERITEGGHKMGPDLWESYVTGPEAHPDPATWATELNRPLAD